MSNDVKKRGFASMDPEKRKQIASLGGFASQKKGTAYHFSHDVAVKAGKKGRKKRATIAI